MEPKKAFFILLILALIGSIFLTSLYFDDLKKVDERLFRVFIANQEVIKKKSNPLEVKDEQEKTSEDMRKEIIDKMEEIAGTSSNSIKTETKDSDTIRAEIIDKMRKAQMNNNSGAQDVEENSVPLSETEIYRLDIIEKMKAASEMNN